MENKILSEQGIIDSYRKRLFDAQENTVRKYHSDWTEEQIQQRCKELRDQIIDAEENRLCESVKNWSKLKKLIKK